MDCVNPSLESGQKEVVDALKRKAIKRYEDFLKRVRKGYRPDY